jgi:hypothetical protein
MDPGMEKIDIGTVFGGACGKRITQNKLLKQYVVIVLQFTCTSCSKLLSLLPKLAFEIPDPTRPFNHSN